MSRRSKATAAERIRILGRFGAKTGWTPASIVEKVREDVRARPDKNGETFEDVFDDFIQDERDKGRKPSYLENYKKTLSSWLKHNSLPFFDLRDIYIGDTRSTPTLDGEAAPTPAELRRILHRATVRGRAIIALMAFAGLRPEVMGDFDGTDGLRVADLEDFALEGGRVRLIQTPAKVTVRRELSKAGHAYYTFLTTEGAEIVRAYLQSRLDRGEVMTNESAVIRVTPGFERKGVRKDAVNFGSEFIVARNVTREVREAFGSDFKARPYVLRSYFDTNLLLTESRAGLPRDYRVFWMGHKGDIEGAYTTNKVHRGDLKEDMRGRFAEAEAYLSTEAEIVMTERAERDALRRRVKELEGEVAIYHARYGNILAALGQSRSFEEFQTRVNLEEFKPPPRESPSARRDIQAVEEVGE